MIVFLSNFFFFTGENEYAVSREIMRWKEAFVAKHGMENLLLFDGGSLKLSDLLDAVETLPFIAEKRLVIVDGVPKFDRHEMEMLPGRIHPQTVAVIMDPSPDKRLSAVKALEKVAEVKRFPLLRRPELMMWLRTEIAQEGGSISQGAILALLDTVGEDQRVLSNELRKLILFVAGREITESDVETLSVPSGTQVIWKLTDLIGSGRATEALLFLKNRLERGEDPYGMWVILLNMVKNLVLVQAAIKEGITTERSIGEAFGVHPFSIRGILPLARILSHEKVCDLLQWVTDADIRLKSGGYHYSADRPQELVALTERVILACA
jgi:DNA polymerase-3 subunit delta